MRDQSYLFYMLGEAVLGRLLLPLGHLTEAEVRKIAADLGFRTAVKPESQDVCFITNQHGREVFLGDRIGLKPGVVVDRQGVTVGRVGSVELMTVGQRKGLGLAGGAGPHYVIDVDPMSSSVIVGTAEDRLVGVTPLDSWVWTGEAVGGEVELQCSAHGEPARGEVVDGFVGWRGEHRCVAAG